jgi:hypothetical protein
MPDIATLGIKIDSSQATAATKNLDLLARAAAKADSSSAALAASAAKQGAAMKAWNQAPTALVKTFAELDKLQKVVDANQARMAASGTKAGKAFDALQKSAGLARHELINLSRQAQDVYVSLASGQNPFLVLIQQGTQIGDIFGSTTGTMRGFGAQLAGIITPLRLFNGVVGLTAAAVVAAGLSWKNYALQLDDAAKQAGVTSREMSKLQATASFKGIGNSDFNEAMARFSGNVEQARIGVGELAGLLRVNGAQAKGVSDAFAKVADLVKNARTDQQRLNILQEAGLPATMQWVRFMSQGADGLSRAKSLAAAFGGDINDKLVKYAQRAEEVFNRNWTNALLKIRNLFVDIVDAVARFNAVLEGNGINKLIRAVMPLAYLARALGAEDPDANGMPPEGNRAPTRLTVTPGRQTQSGSSKTQAERIHELMQFTPQLGVLGDLPTANAPAVKEDAREAA